MVKNGDVMRSDRLKQVMQDIDPTFDEKNLGKSKFSKFCQEAAEQGLIKVIKLENGQLESRLPNNRPVPAPPVYRHRADRAAAGGGSRARQRIPEW
jgi:hypothetical protein